MIIVRLMGGHSNQLFQYALGRSLATRHNTELKLDTSWFNTQPDDTRFPRHYELGDYPLKASVATKSDLNQVNPGESGRSLLSKLLGKTSPDSNFQTISETSLSFDKKILDSADNSYLIGYWQNENYFRDIRSELVLELEPTKPMSKSNKGYLSQINATEAISLHVRREDYVGVDVFNKYHGLTPLEYYKQALELVMQQTPKKNHQLFVFSTDMEWCKQNIKFDCPITFVEGNRDGSEDMRLMKHCKHNIMANSSFSWWGAWLNQNPNKIVVAPKVWFKDVKANRELQLPKKWVRL